MNIKDIEKYILSKPYTKKRIIKKFKQIRFTAADFPIAKITLSATGRILLAICADDENLLKQRKDYPQSITPCNALDSNKWNIFILNNTILQDYIFNAIDIAYKFQMAKKPNTHEAN